MKISLHVQGPKTQADATLQHSIVRMLQGENYDSIRVSVAYMTVSGVRALLPNLVAMPPVSSKWLIGLDDYVTQPGAIDVVSRIPGSVIRIASFRELGLRFHPKVYIFGQSANTRRAISIVGSSNLTASALSGNCEANVLIDSRGENDLRDITNMWEELWRMGHKLTTAELADYKKKYEIYKAQRDKQNADVRSKSKKAILSSDEAELDPAKAKICWIECGYITAMGREIELKAEQGLFFGLDPSGEAPRLFDFLVSNGSVVKLRMKYQGNHMWRLQLTKNVPEVAAGLRPVKRDGSLGRSPYVTVIERVSGSSTYRLRFIGLSSSEFTKLAEKSKATGTFGETTARKYGWC